MAIEETHLSTDKGKAVAAGLPPQNLEEVKAWGGASRGMSHVFRPTMSAQIQDIFTLAYQTGRSVGLKGGGNSYGDAFSNRENIVLTSAA